MKKSSLTILLAIAQLGTYEDMVKEFNHESDYFYTQQKSLKNNAAAPENLEKIDDDLRAEWSLRLGRDVIELDWDEIEKIKSASLLNDLLVREMCALGNDFFNLKSTKRAFTFLKISQNLKSLSKKEKELLQKSSKAQWWHVIDFTAGSFQDPKKQIAVDKLSDPLLLATYNLVNAESKKDGEAYLSDLKNAYFFFLQNNDPACVIPAESFETELAENLVSASLKYKKFLDTLEKTDKIPDEAKIRFADILSRQYIKVSRFENSAWWDEVSQNIRKKIGWKVSDLEYLRTADKYFDAGKLEKAEDSYRELVLRAKDTWVKTEAAVALVEIMKERITKTSPTSDREWELLERHRVALNEAWRSELRDPLLKSYIENLQRLSLKKDALIYADLLKRSGLERQARVDGLKISIALKKTLLDTDLAGTEKEKLYKNLITDYGSLVGVDRRALRKDAQSDIKFIESWRNKLLLNKDPSVSASIYELKQKLDLLEGEDE